MKSITKLMVVAMLLVAALVVAPVAARNVGDGDNVYIGEKHVNLDALFGGGAGSSSSGNLVYYSNVATPDAATIGKAIPVTDTADFELTTADFSATGAWYAFDKSNPAKLTNQSAADGYILVEKPSVSLDVKLAGTTDSVDGRPVTPDARINFEIKHNIRLGAADATKDNGFFMKIEVTTPDGGTVTSLNNVGLGSLLLTDTSVKSVPIPLKDLKSGTYTAQAKWGNTSLLDSASSNPVTFDIRTKALSITSSKDSVVRSKNFMVTIAGDSKTKYWVFVRSADIGEGEYPKMLPSQPGVNATVDLDTDELPVGTIAGENPSLLNLPFAWGQEWVNKTYVPEKSRTGPVERTIAVVETKADGTRAIEFETGTDTKDRQFTIRVQNKDERDKYDDVRVKIEEGGVTIVTSGTGTYYLGEEITLSGTCTESQNVYLFLTGPNLKTNGVNLNDLGIAATSGTTSTFKEVGVDVDDTWSYKWNTAEILNGTLDAGGYSIWAVSKPRNKEDLSDASYATTSVHLRTGFLTATSSGASLAKGDNLKITGTAMGDPSNIYVWIFGKNKQILGESATVESDGSFEYELKGGETKEWSPGQYFVVIQHPMMDDAQGIFETAPGSGWISGPPGSGFTAVQISRLQASDAANVLIQALDSPNIDDTYVKLTFNLEEPYIFIDSVGTKEAGSKFTVTGTTNVAVGDILIVDVTSAAFGPTVKTEASGFGAVSGTAIVEKGDGANKWSFDVDASDLKPDQYIVKVECIETETTATANFDVVEATEKPTTPPTGETTTPPAGETTTPAGGDETPTEAPPTPGFGALVALAGLGAVAFLVLRRK